MKYICPQISRSSINSGNRWSVRRVECFLPDILLRILICVSDPLSGWNSTRKPSWVFHFFFLLCMWVLHFHYFFMELLSESFFQYFRHFFRAIFQSSIFSIYMFSKCVKFNELDFFVSGELHEEWLNASVYWYISPIISIGLGLA